MDGKVQLAEGLCELIGGDAAVSVSIDGPPHRLRNLGVGESKSISKQNSQSADAFLLVDVPVPVPVEHQNHTLGLSAELLQVSIHHHGGNHLHSSQVNVMTPLRVHLGLRIVDRAHKLPGVPGESHVLQPSGHLGFGEGLAVVLVVHLHRGGQDFERLLQETLCPGGPLLQYAAYLILGNLLVSIRVRRLPGSTHVLVNPRSSVVANAQGLQHRGHLFSTEHTVPVLVPLLPGVMGSSSKLHLGIPALLQLWRRMPRQCHQTKRCHTSHRNEDRPSLSRLVLRSFSGAAVHKTHLSLGVRMHSRRSRPNPAECAKV
mmetsp:Transcript_5528/g.13713  ORF Transcript_5528/g.13713 Transcript_5528/m.13713 type:complete len:316 (+) Transcript_5528:647-1594(+)